MPTTISGFVNNGITLTSAAQGPLTVTSTGVIDNPNYGGYGVLDWTGASLDVTNSGGIFAFGGSSVGVYIGQAGGTVTNNAGADIYGGANGVYIASGSLTNSGHIVGGTFIGVAAGTSVDVANKAGGVIDGGIYGVQLQGHATLDNAGSVFGGSVGVTVSGGTLVNAGTITGGTLAVSLFSIGAGYTSLLVVDPGAVFNGVARVQDGSPATLEFAKGATAGQINGIGTEFQNFTNVIIDPGANWTLVGANTLSSDVSLSNFGALTVGNDGASLVGGGTVLGSIVDNGLIQATSGTFEVTGAVTGTGSLSIAPGAELRLDGAVALSGRGPHMTFTGASETLGLVATGNVGATIKGFGIGDAIDLIGHTATGFDFVGNRLDVFDGSRLIDRLHFQPGLTEANFQLSYQNGGTDILFHAAGAQVAGFVPGH